MSLGAHEGKGAEHNAGEGADAEVRATPPEVAVQVLAEFERYLEKRKEIRQSTARKRRGRFRGLLN
jgi:hypothetical protein